ncbi:unnamed protein product [Pocillopora meandrina]|uniref:Uncharacterized protein n=1 Tax=Pocillopora meandrina TaxID=46732 RepID=A0AAU9XW92_9CNID|nr:unnamed protein product [Pocillopora meandrina]
MFSKFKIEKAPSALYRREPSHFEVKQSAISLPLLEACDQRIRHLRAENEQLRAEKVEHVKIINGQATELAERRAEVFQLRQELQLLRHEVSKKKNTVKFNISRKSYWDVDRAARSLKRKKIGDYLRNAAKILPAEFKPIECSLFLFFTQVKFNVSGRELVIPLSDYQYDGDDDEDYAHEVVQRMLAAKDEGLVSDKAYHELRMALLEKVRSHVPPLSAIKQERSSQNKEIKVIQIPEAKQADGARRSVRDVLQYLIAIPEVKDAIKKDGSKIKLRFAADGRRTSKRIGTVMAVFNILCENKATY